MDTPTDSTAIAADASFFSSIEHETHFYLVRHGESEGNARRTFQGRLDLPLAESGRGQARAPIKSGVLKLLAYLHRRGTAMAVATSTRTATTMDNLRRADIAHYFGAVIGGDAVQNAKPAPTSICARCPSLAPRRSPGPGTPGSALKGLRIRPAVEEISKVENRGYARITSFCCCKLFVHASGPRNLSSRRGSLR
jgi:hypothetical protein